MTAQAETASSAQQRRQEFLESRLQSRLKAGDDFFAASAGAIAGCAAAMADRFFRGGTLLVMGGGASATDAQHNSVEYVHPVLPGCRALPALSLANDVALLTGGLEGDQAAAVYSHQLRVLGRRGDIALAFTRLPLPAAVDQGLQAARSLGMLTVALSGGGDQAVAADHCLQVRSGDPLIVQELHLATYHMLWELVHIVLNHRGIAR